jgi:uroporphyrin-III C-methyltransferase
MNAQTTVWMVGAGPGSVDLLTVKAMRLIQSAQWILHDALVSQDILDLAPQATLIDVGKRAGSERHATRQHDINRLLVDAGRIAQAQGGLVVRLKGGDPLIFARAEEEMLALEAAGISFAVVPGITAAQAAHAQIRQPLTRRGSQRSFVLTTPQVQAGDSMGTEWARPLVAARAGAIYMAASATSRIKGTLLALGLSANTPVCWVLNAGQISSSVIQQSLGALSFPATQNAPALLLVGTTPWNSSSASTGITSATSSVSSPLAHWSDSLSA